MTASLLTLHGHNYRLKFPGWIVATILIVVALTNELLISPELITEVPP